MKLLLIQPPIQDFYDTDIRLQPLGLAYLKAAVQKYLPQIEVVIGDYHHGWGRRTFAIPKELSYLKDYYEWPDESPFRVFHAYYHFGASFEKIAEQTALIKPDLVGISSLFSPYYREVLKTAECIKKAWDVPIITGGSHVSAEPELMLRDPHIDFVIQGEGERALVEFLKTFASGRDFEKVPGLGFKRSGQLIFNPVSENYPIEEIPNPDFSDLPQSDYLLERKPLSFVITSRSCPHRCSFCSVHLTFGTSYRRRSVESVLEEIQNLYSQGIRVFDFEDDNLTYYRPEMKELCRGLIEAFPKKDVRFVAMNGISYLSLDTELLVLMKEAGFTDLNLALVTSDVTVRQTTKRPHTTEKYLQVVEEASRLGFSIVSYQILGLPEETLESMIQTLVFNARLPVLLGSSMFYLTPNSPAAKSFPALSEEEIFKARLTAMAVETGSFKREDIFTLFITTRILNFLKGISLQQKQASLRDALSQAELRDSRSAVGCRILETLLKERILYASTKQGWKVIKKFKADLFFEVWNQIGRLATQQAGFIDIPVLKDSPNCGGEATIQVEEPILTTSPKFRN